jgi:hypothetical protein
LDRHQLCRGPDPSHRSDETITAPGNRSDAAGYRLAAIENPANSGNLHVQIVVVDHRLRPSRGDDLVPRNEIPCMADQHAENIERPRTDRHRGKDAIFTALEQPAGAPVEAKPFEQEDVVAVGHGHAGICHRYSLLAKNCARFRTF